MTFYAYLDSQNVDMKVAKFLEITITCSITARIVRIAHYTVQYRYNDNTVHKRRHEVRKT